jgi:predicted phage-related endonuclease
MTTLQLREMIGEPDRTTYIGGSDAAAVVGFGAYGKTPYTTWLAKTKQEIEVITPEKRKFFDRRKRFEPLIVEMLREECDAEIINVGKRYYDSEYDFMAAEIDFEWRDPETGLIENGEIKTVDPRAFGEKHGWGDAGTDEVPIHYAAQCVHGLGVTKRNKTLLVPLVGFDTMLFYQINRDDEMIADMRHRCVRFWMDNVLGMVEPDPLVIEDLEKMLLKREGIPVLLGGEQREILREIKAFSEQEKLARERKADRRYDLLLWLCKQWGAPTPEVMPKDNALLQITDDGAPVTIAKFSRQVTTRIDSDRLKLELPDVVRKYSKATETRVLRTIKPKTK